MDFWSHDARGWSVILFRGSWPKHLSDLMVVNKRISPEGVTLSVENLRDATSEIQS